MGHGGNWRQEMRPSLRSQQVRRTTVASWRGSEGQLLASTLTGIVPAGHSPPDSARAAQGSARVKPRRSLAADRHPRPVIRAPCVAADPRSPADGPVRATAPAARRGPRGRRERVRSAGNTLRGRSGSGGRAAGCAAHPCRRGRAAPPRYRDRDTSPSPTHPSSSRSATCGRNRPGTALSTAHYCATTVPPTSVSLRKRRARAVPRRAARLSQTFPVVGARRVARRLGSAAPAACAWVSWPPARGDRLARKAPDRFAFVGSCAGAHT